MNSGKVFELMDQMKWNIDFQDGKIDELKKKKNKNIDMITDCLTQITKKQLPLDTVHLEHVRIESFDTEKWMIDSKKYNDPLISMLVQAFHNHSPIAITPDLIYGYIAKGFANHINEHSEDIRTLFVSHDGKEGLVYRNDSFILGSADNDWGLFFTDMTRQLKEKTNSMIIQKDLEFSTSTPLTITHRHVLSMEAMEKYFEYEMLTFCGIAAVTLLGTSDDWWKLVKVVKQQFEEINQWCKEQNRLDLSLEWWESELIPVLEKMATAFTEDLCKEKCDELQNWFCRILKYHHYYQSGQTPKVSGWINALFPYLKHKEKNPWFEKEESEISPNKYSSCNGTVNFKWNHCGNIMDMRALIGYMFMGRLLEKDSDCSVLPVGSIMLFPAWVIGHTNGAKKV